MRHDFATYMDEPELIAICQQCKRPDCVGTCEEYGKKWREIAKQHEGVARSTHGQYEAFGEKHTIAEWARIYGITYNALYRRVVSRHWPIEKALNAYRQGGQK